MRWLIATMYLALDRDMLAPVRRRARPPGVRRATMVPGTSGGRRGFPAFDNIATISGLRRPLRHGDEQAQWVQYMFTSS